MEDKNREAQREAAGKLGNVLFLDFVMTSFMTKNDKNASFTVSLYLLNKASKMEIGGLEPLTYALRTHRSPN